MKVSLGRGRDKVSEGQVREDRKAKLKSQNGTFWTVPFSAQSEARNQVVRSTPVNSANLIIGKNPK